MHKYLNINTLSWISCRQLSIFGQQTHCFFISPSHYSTMHQKVILPLALLLLGFYYCEKPGGLHTPEAGQRPLSFVYLHDLSKTCRHIAAPDAHLLRNHAKCVAATGGAIALCLVGTPDSTGRMIRQRFLPLPGLPASPTYLDKIEFQQKSDSIREINRMLIEEFVQKCLYSLQKYPLQDYTDLNGAFAKIDSYFHEPGMEAFLPVLFIDSDGLEDTRIPQLPVDTVVRPQLLSADIKVMVCGWKFKDRPQNWIVVESPEALPTALNSFISKQYCYD